jgi:hypothetical protein
MRYLIVSLMTLASCNLTAQIIPLNKIISFVGKDEKTISSYLQEEGWEFGNAEQDSVNVQFDKVAWLLFKKDDRHKMMYVYSMVYFVYRSSHYVKIMILNLYEKEYYNTMKVLPTYGFIKKSVDRIDKKLVIEFEKGHLHVDVYQEVLNNESSYSLHCYH